ncbi:MAG TPA: nuclear transport factor 2 family protein [Steroidobacteraceae bacterium]|nr:nuclear transport factor 2 family protein [Steroidobacteraceae bacterium]
MSHTDLDARASERIAALESELLGLRQRVLLLEDRNEVVNLQRTYGYYLDKALFDELLALLTEDVSLEYSGRGVYLGKARARKLMQMMPGGQGGLAAGMLQNHMQLQGVVHLAPDGRSARGRWRAFIMMGSADGQAAWQEGIYENEYRKEAGIWKISKVHFYCNVNADYETAWAKAPRGVPGISSAMPPDLPPSDPDYRPYPAAYVPPFHYPNPARAAP